MTMRRFIQSARILSESVTGDTELDNLIDHELERLYPDEREQVLDALMIVRKHRNDPDGVSVETIFDELDALYDNGGFKNERDPQQPSYEVIIKQLKTAFMGSVIMSTRGANNEERYTWIWDDGTDASPDRNQPLDMTSMTSQLAQKQIEITHEIIERAKRMGRFNIGGMARVAMSHGIPSEMAMILAQHAIEQMGGLFKSLGDGEYEYVAEPRVGAMDTRNDAAARATKNRTIDGNPE